MKNGFISIVLTLYNKAPYVEETIFSIYKQTYTNWELIILDDCSTDGSFEIAKSFCEKLGISSKCRFIQNEKNLGLSKNTLKGLRLSKGEYIALVDADDILVKNKLEKNINFCKKENLDFCYSDLTTIDENGKIKNISINNILHNGENKDSTKIIIANGLCFTSSMLFKNTIAKKIIEIGIPKEIYQDHRISIISSILGYKIGFIKESLVYYRVIPGNMSYKERWIAKKNILTIYENHLQKLRIRCIYLCKNIQIKSKLNYLDKRIKLCDMYINRLSDLKITPQKILLKCH